MPLILTAGEAVTVGRRDTTWPAFVFVATSHGEGWVPARHLSADLGPAVVMTPYDTTELVLTAGQTVEVLDRDDESGWWWCAAEDGTAGWVPMDALVPED